MENLLTFLSTKQLIFIIIMNAVVLISLPISLYGIYKLYVNRHESFVIKRNYNIVILNLTFFIIYQIGEYVLGNLFIIYGKTFIEDGLGNSLIVCVIMILFGALLPSNWMRLYMNNWFIEISNKKWRHIINGHNTDNWYVKNKCKYGSWNYVCKMVTIFVIIIGIISCILCYFVSMFLFGDGSQLLLGALLCVPLATSVSIPALILIVIIRKTPIFDDMFYIDKENSMKNNILLIWIIICFGVAIHVVIALVTGISVEDAAVDAVTWHCLASGIIGGLYIVSSTLLVIYDNTNITNDLAMHTLSKNTLSLALLNEEKTEAFIEHLIKEINIETILSYIELNQFIKYIAREHNVDINYKTGTYINIYN